MKLGIKNSLTKISFWCSYLKHFCKTWFSCLKLDVRIEWGNKNKLRSQFHIFCNFYHSCLFVCLFVLSNKNIWGELLFSKNGCILLLSHGLTSALHRLRYSGCKTKMGRGEGQSAKSCGNWKGVIVIQSYVIICHLEKELFYYCYFSLAF